MKVLQITSDYPPIPLWGMGWHVSSLVNILKKKDQEVILATANKSKNYHKDIITTTPEEDKEYLSDGKFEIFNDFDKYNTWQLLLADRIKKDAIDFDIVHCHNWMSWLTAKRLQETNPELKIITSFHFLQKQYDLMADNPIPNNHYQIIDLETEAIDRSNAVIVLSESQKELLLNKYNVIDSSRVHVIPYGIEFPEMSYDKLLEVKNKNDYLDISFAGRIEKDKGVEKVLDAFTKLRSKYDNIRLNIIGKGTLVDELSDRYKNESIIFHGYLSKAEMQEVLSKSWIFCMPSSSETLGMTVLEAMYFGVAPIYSRGETVPLLFVENESGITVPLIKEDDIYTVNIDDVAKQIELLINDRNLLKKISLNAYRVANDNYSLDSMGRRIIEIYKQ